MPQWLRAAAIAAGMCLLSAAPALADGVAADSKNAKMTCSPSTGGRIALSANGMWHGSSGGDQPVVYPNTLTNLGNAWTGGGVFQVPAGCKGPFYLSVSFEKDSTRICNGPFGTTDDVRMYFTVNGVKIGNSAWSGQNTGERDSASFDEVVLLSDGDQVKTMVYSDGGLHRCLGEFNVTIFNLR